MSLRRMALASLWLFVPCTARATDWPQLGFDGARSRGSDESSGATFVPAWTHDLQSGAIVATPVVSDGLVAIAGTNGTIAALDTRTGETSWSRDLGGRIGATPAVARAHLIVPTLNGQLFGLRLTDGRVDWQRAFGLANYASPTLAEDPSASAAKTIVLPEGFPAQTLWRLDAATGAPSWRTAPGAIADLMDSSPAVVGGRAIVGMNHGRFQSIDLATGASGWTFDPSGDVFLSSPLVQNERVYMFPGDHDGRLFAVGIEDGVPVAGFPLAIPDPAPVVGGQLLGHGPAVSSVMAVGGLLVVQLRRQDMITHPDGSFGIILRESVAGIDARVPRVVWQHALGTIEVPNANGVPELAMTPTPAGFLSGAEACVVVSSSLTPRIAILDVATGTERWSAPLSSPGRSSPVFANGQLFVATDAGMLHVFSSDVNHQPNPPTELTVATENAPNGASFAWAAATDPDGDALTYRIRVQRDGNDDDRIEWTTTTAGDVSAASPVALVEGTLYTVSVRSRDAHGALSAWSTGAPFHLGAAAMNPPPSPPPGTMSPAPVPIPIMTGPGDEGNGAAAGCAVSGRSDVGLETFLLLTALFAPRRKRRSRAR